MVAIVASNRISALHRHTMASRYEETDLSAWMSDLHYSRALAMVGCLKIVDYETMDSKRTSVDFAREPESRISLVVDRLDSFRFTVIDTYREPVKISEFPIRALSC